MGLQNTGGMYGRTYHGLKASYEERTKKKERGRRAWQEQCKDTEAQKIWNDFVG